ncbi:MULTISPECIES: hypothetical protein [Peptoniphilaceae]|uniref:hypothetical protein n=1 Tax=Peptoniphilaceae TaxID=1570339 RepID=UPI0028037747|nr:MULTISPECIES: hypothetical protein [Peptoniphilaceae]MDU4391933.1 hypothetical protein [Klebsiella michiganensis]MDU2220202.1 hypothetical protein [Finegoldia magna]MDU4278228.1 hypothetical protein [Finegoldia magna]MDU5070755.1 hypothetical protein [Finegoldia magna]MDU7303368.1 hypothetical protein [Peptoniphilus lacydonensis]
MNKTKNKSLWTLIIGVVCLGIAFILKDFEFGFLGNLRPIGFVTIYICPIVGIIGIVFSLIEKSVARALLNFLLVLSFPILMLMGHLFIK